MEQLLKAHHFISQSHKVNSPTLKRGCLRVASKLVLEAIKDDNTKEEIVLIEKLMDKISSLNNIYFNGE